MNNKINNYRWTICGLIFFATTINYIDRQVISLLKPFLEKEFNWTETDYSNIVIAFQISYAIGLLGFGRFIDRIGTKIGYVLSITLWSIAAVAHALAKGTIGFIAARSFLGISEAGNFPAAIKATAEWFPKKERALATGIFNSGTNIGAIIAPLTVPLIAETWGWQWAFILTGLIGFVWIIFWWIFYDVPEKQKRLSKAELDYINSDKEDQVEISNEKVSWKKLMGFRQTWAFVIGKFLTDPIWWFFLFWLPAFLKEEYGLVGKQISFPIAVVYILTCIGSIGGGWLSSKLIKMGWQVNTARKVSMLGFAICVVPIVFAQLAGSVNMWYAVLLIGLAASAHQAWSANIYTTASDMFPKKAIGSIIGIGGMAGAVGGIVLSRFAGVLLDHYKTLGQIKTAYYILFFIAGSAYLLALLIFHTLAPKMKQVEM